MYLNSLQNANSLSIFINSSNMFFIVVIRGKQNLYLQIISMNDLVSYSNLKGCEWFQPSDGLN